MAKNREFEDTNTCTVAAVDCVGPNAPIKSGDPIVYGSAKLPAVALADQRSDGTVTVQFGGRWPTYRLAVDGQGAAAAAAIAAGAPVFFDAGPTPDQINADFTNGSRYGVALDPVAAGATTTIRVLVGA